MKLLMLSSSREGQSAYLQSAREMILPHLQGVEQILFVPFAGVTLDWDSYTDKVQRALPEFEILGLHRTERPADAIRQASSIMVGGGNTFNLLNELYRQQLLEPVRQAVHSGIPYVGWSAGANICGDSIRTTNDMPIVQPPSFDALKLVPFQINPHYTDYQVPGHNGETRADRLAEFMVLNPAMPVLAIREGSALKREDDKLHLLGAHPALIFAAGHQTSIQPGTDLSDYLEESR